MKILNFGAGHGGFSILTSFLGAHVTEIDTTDYDAKCFNHNIHASLIFQKLKKNLI